LRYTRSDKTDAKGTFGEVLVGFVGVFFLMINVAVSCS
jgi:hypothetical protein